MAIMIILCVIIIALIGALLGLLVSTLNFVKRIFGTIAKIFDIL